MRWKGGNFSKSEIQEKVGGIEGEQKLSTHTYIGWIIFYYIYNRKPTKKEMKSSGNLKVI